MEKTEFNYFKMLREMVEGSMAAATLLNEILNDYKPSELITRMSEMHEIEHSNDGLIHITQSHLIKEFLTPIDREDIQVLIEELDEPTDSIEDVLFALYMYNIHEIKPEALKFSQLICSATDALYEAIIEFQNYNKNSEIRDKIIEVNRLEEEGDNLHLNAIRNLYIKEKDAKELLIWTRTFDKLERCLDDIEKSANLLQSIILKNF